MKNNYVYRLVFLLLLVPAICFATDTEKDKYEKSKTLKKEYTVNKDALLKINNRYGNIDVVSWDKNQVVIEVKITVSGNDESQVIERLKMIDVEFQGSRSEVSAETIIEKKSSNWSWSWGKKRNVHYKINYTVKVPLTNNVKLANDYGNIFLNELKGDADINCDYGKISIGDLHSTNNSINIDYCGSSTIGKMNGGSINADYSKLTVEEAGDIRLNADYTTTVFEKINDLNYNCDYGSLQVSDGRSVIGTGDYLTTKLGAISKKVDITADYGSIRIDDLKAGFDSVTINGDYCGVKIGTPDAPFNFILKLSYGSFKRGDVGYEFIKQVVKSQSKYYEGYYKSQNSKSIIKVDSDYGSVTFYE
tara:strand:+ start:133 stop:1218 length:1086 start_codon:yes stop_codon:yes gene_type:complete